MRKGVTRHHFISMFFAVCWMFGLALFLFTAQTPSASAMLKELAVPGVSTEPLTELEPITQAVGAGEHAVTALTPDPVSSVIPKPDVAPVSIETPIQTPDDIAEPEAAALVVPQLSIDTPSGRVQTPVVKADNNELQQGVRSLPDKVHTNSIRTPAVLDELLPEVNHVQPETTATASLAPSVWRQPEDDHAPTSTAVHLPALHKIRDSQVPGGKSHQRKQSHGIPRLPLNERSSPYPAQAVGTPQVTAASVGGSGGQAAGSGSAGSAGWWVAVPEPVLFGDPNVWSERIAARYLLGFDQWCQPPPEEPPMESFFSNF